jgi:hypothetical protein
VGDEKEFSTLRSSSSIPPMTFRASTMYAFGNCHLCAPHCEVDIMHREKSMLAALILAILEPGALTRQGQLPWKWRRKIGTCVTCRAECILQDPDLVVVILGVINIAECLYFPRPTLDEQRQVSGRGIAGSPRRETC